MEQLKLYGPGTKVETGTLEEVRRERDGLGVVEFKVLLLGGKVREINLMGVVANGMTPDKVVIEVKRALRMSKDRKVVLASVIDYDKPVLTSDMSRTKEVVVLNLGELVEKLPAKDVKFDSRSGLSVAAERCTNHFLLELTVVAREAKGARAKGGRYRAEVVSGLLYGEGFYRKASTLFADLFREETFAPNVIGEYTDYVPFLVLPSDFEMGRIPIARTDNDEYWKNKPVLSVVLVPKELV